MQIKIVLLYGLFTISTIYSNQIKKFKNWIESYKIEVKNIEHFNYMFENWLDNDKFINFSNSQNLTYTLGHNSFSGMNWKEFYDFMGFTYNINPSPTTDVYQTIISDSEIIFSNQDYTIESVLPDYIDWREKNVVTNIQNQLNCGSCYSFSSTATLESAVAIKYGKLTKLSEQQIVSCSAAYGNNGCNGGLYSSAWNFVTDNGGQCSLQDYSYTSANGDDGNCVVNCEPVFGTKVHGFENVKPKSDHALMSALTKGPVSISIEADARSFQLYSGGIYSDFLGCNKNSARNKYSRPNINHAVVLVGYGSKNGLDYYILRNSWGTSWGLTNTENKNDQGYMFISRGVEYEPYGMCGLLYDPAYPIV